MTENRQRWLITLLLVVLGGALGLHRFYVGKIKTGIAMLLTGGGCGIWALIDLIIVVMGRFETSEGERITYG